jgi:hypothetical protein
VQEASDDRDLVFTQPDAFYERHFKPNNTILTIGEVIRALNEDVRCGRTSAVRVGAT